MDLRKAIHFDLDSNKLRQFFDKTPQYAYKLIEAFLLENHFEHRQYSGYYSKQGMSQAETETIVLSLCKEFPWISNCVKSLTITSVENIVEYAYMLQHVEQQDQIEQKPIERNNLNEENQMVDIIEEKGEEEMTDDFAKMKHILYKLINADHRNFVKALFSIETDIEDEQKLEDMYEYYLDDSDLSLIDDHIVEMADKIKSLDEMELE